MTPVCRRSPCRGAIDDATQRCRDCGAWWEPVTLMPAVARFDAAAVRRVLARPMGGER